MRFELGPVPVDGTFDPDAEGWTRLRELRSGLLMLFSIPLGAVLAGLVLWIWTLILPAHMPAGGRIALSIDVRQLAVFVLVVVAFLLAHELLHMLPAFLAGRSSDVVIGFWPRYFAPYAALTGALSRNAQLLCGVTPLVVLTVLPLPLGMVAPRIGWWLAALGVVNALGSGADLITLVLLVRQVPRAAVVRSQGVATYWRATG